MAGHYTCPAVSVANQRRAWRKPMANSEMCKATLEDEGLPFPGLMSSEPFES